MVKDVAGRTEAVRRRHVWKPFSVRIEQIKIDVIHTVDRIDADDALVESHFVSGLKKWNELNQSSTYTLFANGVEKSAQTLAQPYLSKDLLRFRALTCSLLVRLVRDLQGDFLQYLLDCLRLTANLVASHEVETIEAAFQSIAFIFKYLTKIASSRLNEIYEIFSPLLGRNNKPKPYQVRFVAESLSFLIRKAKPDVRSGFIEYVTQDYMASPRSTAYIGSIALVYAETIKNVNHSIHGLGLSFLEQILDLYTSANTTEPSNDQELLLEYTLVNLLHHCTTITFEPILNHIESLSQNYSLDFSLHLLNSIGTKCIVHLYFTYMESINSVETLEEPPPNHGRLGLDRGVVHLGHEADMENFMLFLYDDIRCLLHQEWDDVSRVRTYCLLEMLQAGVPAIAETRKLIPFQLTMSTQIKLKKELSASVPSDENQAFLASLIKILSSSTICVPDPGPLSQTIDNCLRCANDPTNLSSAAPYPMIIGSCLSGLAVDASTLSEHLIISFIEIDQLWRSSAFLHGLHACLSKTTTLSRPETMRDLLLPNLEYAGHTRRLITLQLLQLLALHENDSERELLGVCEQIEMTDLTLTATRALDMLHRKIAQLEPKIGQPWIKEALVLTSWEVSSKLYAVMELFQQLLERYCKELRRSRNGVMLIRDQLSGQKLPAGTPDLLSQQWQDSEGPVPTVNKRLQALRLLNAIPAIAESNAIHLMAHFQREFEFNAMEVEDGAVLSPHPDYTRMDRTERSVFLSLFASFQNPAAVPDVMSFRAIVMDLLASKDDSTRISALKIILHLRDPAISPYETNLTNLTSDLHSRDEIVSFLEANSSESPIQMQHRSL
ncbi:hypothetical protein MRB53_042148 [Persea americana]|nr:hypothetical protein MRB53_042148 [Persea americana]